MCAYWTADGSLDHVFECGTQPSLWATHPNHGGRAGFAISEGTVANKLKHKLAQAKGIIQRIKDQVIAAPWIGSDETRTHVGGKKFWQWVWQSKEASYKEEHRDN